MGILRVASHRHITAEICMMCRVVTDPATLIKTHHSLSKENVMGN